METASIRHPSYRRYRDPLCLPSRKFTPLLVGRVDSRAPRGALPCTARTSGRSVTMERTSPSAGSRGPLLPRVQLAENSQQPGGEGVPSRGVWRPFSKHLADRLRRHETPIRICCAHSARAPLVPCPCRSHLDFSGIDGSCLTLSATLRQAPIRSETSLSSTSRAPSYSVRFRMS